MALPTFTEQRARWLHAAYDWVRASISPRTEDDSPLRLILPADAAVAMYKTPTHACAEALFVSVKHAMAMEDWACRLVVDEDEGTEMRSSLARAGVLNADTPISALGTFRHDEEIVISYSTTLRRDPVGLVATFAHELAHYLIAASELRSAPPGGWIELEPVTDLVAVSEGFGLFLCDSAFRFSQWSSWDTLGWKADSQGYLSQLELAFALGLFHVRNGIDPKPILPFLSSTPRTVFLDSLDFIEVLDAERGTSS